MSAIHDLVIRHIAQFFAHDNFDSQCALVNLISLNQRFYSIRDIFIKYMSLNCWQTYKALNDQPYGWNSVHTLHLYRGDGYLNVSRLKRIHTIYFDVTTNVVDISSLKSLHTVRVRMCNNLKDMTYFRYVRKLEIICCQSVMDVSPLINVKDLTFFRCHFIGNLPILNTGTVRKLTLREMNICGRWNFSKIPIVTQINCNLV